jgi:hypothetical protein
MIGSGRGHIDFYGHVPATGHYLLGGWASEDLIDIVQAGDLALDFEDGTVVGLASGATYPRPALGGLGTGIIIFVTAADAAHGRLQSVRLGTGTSSVRIVPSPDATAADQATLQGMLGPILPHVAKSLPRLLISHLAPDLLLIRGFIDLAGTLDHTGIICGWAPTGQLGDRQVEASWVTSGQTTTAQATLILHERDGLEGRGVGLILILPFPPADPSPGKIVPTQLRFQLDGETLLLTPAQGAEWLDGARLRDTLRAMLPRLDRGDGHDRLTRLTAPRGYRGGNTLESLQDFVKLEIDDAISCPPGGLILMGWRLAHPDTIVSILLHAGPHITQIRPEHWLPIARGDEVVAIGEQHGISDPRCGFIAYIPEGHAPHATPFLEIRTKRGEVGYRDLPPPRLSGRRAIEALLNAGDFQYADLAPAFDHVLGPAITRLNQHRLARPASTATIQFGTPHPAPRCSVIVPIYRRLDHMDFQAGLLAAEPPCQDVELIYVLDDPPLRRDAENLAAVLHARHAMPITLICLAENRGFAPASNIGLNAARGHYVCLMNSDVFPQGPAWLDRLCNRLEANPLIGVIGPMLVYEDGSVQHRGMNFRRLPQFGNWFFGDHPGKGLKPEPASGLLQCPSITGACMVLRRDLATKLGGFDEGYIIGDFEDSDLCLRLQQRGLHCAVDLDERLYHLERKSQASSALRWRMNLTVYNAWLHHQRWGETLTRLDAA